MFSSLISSNIYQALSKWALTSKEKNIIIDPLSCFIKIGLLNFYQEGTKISITNNQIKFDEPNYFQGVKKKIPGFDERQDTYEILVFPYQNYEELFTERFPPAKLPFPCQKNIITGAQRMQMVPLLLDTFEIISGINYSIIQCHKQHCPNPDKPELNIED